MNDAPARSGQVPATIRRVSIAAFAVVALLFAITWEYLPALRYQWGANLLGYLPDWLAWLVTGLALLTTTEEARRGLIRAAEAVGRLAGRLSPSWRDALVFAGVLTALVSLRERVQLGDSPLLFALLGAERAATHPETGGVFAMRAIFQLADAAGLPPALACQLANCAAGALAVVLVLRAARLALPEDASPAAVPLLVFSGGLFAALAGRHEIEALAVCAAAAHLWLSLRFLGGAGGLAAPALAFGVAAWLQPVYLFAAPGLLWLPRLARRPPGPALALALAPLLLHVLQLLVFAPGPVSLSKVLAHAFLGVGGWVRGWGSGPSLGTDYVLLSLGQLKYLANAALVLAPAGLPLCLGILAVRRRAALRAPALRFVALSTAGLLAGSFARRPVWGPFDWDLFSVTGLWLGVLAGLLVCGLESRSVRAQVAAAAVGLQVCFVGFPMVAIGQGASVDAGPFKGRDFSFRLAMPGERPPRKIRRWL